MGSESSRLGHVAIVALPLSALDTGDEPGFPCATWRWPRRAPGKRLVSVNAGGAHSGAPPRRAAIGRRRPRGRDAPRHGVRLERLIERAGAAHPVEPVASADAAAVRPAPQIARGDRQPPPPAPVAAASPPRSASTARTTARSRRSPSGARPMPACWSASGGGSPARPRVPRWYQQGAAPARTCSTWGRRPGRTSTPREGLGDRRQRPRRGRQARRQSGRPATVGVSFGDGLGDERPADPSIAVGTPVLAASSKLGTAVDVAAVEEQALAAHASDGGNNVSVSVYPSPGSLP